MSAARIGMLVLAGLVLPEAIAAQASFEGTVTYRMSGPMSMEMVHHVRGNRVRQEASGPMGPMIIIVDTESMEMTMLVPAQKSYMKMNMNDMQRMAEQMQQQSGAKGEVEITPTGEEESIAGHACKHYVFAQNTTEVDICAATGLGYYMAGSGMNSPGGGNTGPNMSGLLDTRSAEFRRRFPDGFFPMKMTIHNQGTTMVMEVTSLEPKTLSDDLFDVPADYTEIKMPAGGV